MLETFHLSCVGRVFSPEFFPHAPSKNFNHDGAGDDDLRGVIMDSGDDSVEAECVRASLTAADLEGLDVYDFDMYVESACLTPEYLPNGCNFMGLGQACRGCYETCEGALYYIKMHQDEIALKVGKGVFRSCISTYVHSRHPHRFGIVKAALRLLWHGVSGDDILTTDCTSCFWQVLANIYRLNRLWSLSLQPRIHAGLAPIPPPPSPRVHRREKTPS